MPHIIAENIDRVASVEMRPSGGNLPRGFIHKLYNAMRAEQGGGPLVGTLVDGLRRAVRPGDTVFVVTGAGGAPALPAGEVDGIPGAAVIGRALHVGLAAEVVILSEARTLEPMRAALAGCGVNAQLLGGPRAPHAITLISTEEDDDAWATQYPALLDRFSPSAMIAIEKLSPNERGVIHSVTGVDFTSTHTDPAPLFADARRRGIFTAGIGDGGNEVGFGPISQEVRDAVVAGLVCACPCGAGMASSVAVDSMLVSAISDWGAYAICAMLAFELGDPSLLVTERDIERMLTDVVAAGAFDGTTARPTLSDDGVDLKVQLAFVRMLAGIVENGLQTVESSAHSVADTVSLSGVVA